MAPRRRLDRADEGLRRAMLLAVDVGQRDLTRTRPAPRVARAPLAPAARAARVARNLPVVRIATETPSRAPRAARTFARSAPDAPAAPVTIPARLELGALTAPLSPIRTVSAARLRPATLSEEPMRPRVTHASAGGRRLARLAPEESATSLRVSRPIGGAPTLREVGFATDNGPRIDELRSAVDDFRASVADDSFGNE